MHVTDYLKRFDEHLQAAGFAKLSRQSYARSLKKLCNYLEYSNGPMEADQIRRKDLVEFLANCEEAGEKRSSIILRLLICKKFFGWLKEERLIAEDPAATIPVPKEEKKVPRYVSPQQIESLLRQPDTGTRQGLRDRALLEVVYSAGLRISEALDLEIQDVNFQEGFVHVRNGKGGKARTVPIGKEALAWLTRYLEEGRRRLLSCSCTEVIFLNQSGQQLSRQSAAAVFRGYVQSAGLPSWLSCHSLRHGCAQHMLEGGARLPYLQEMLGHACMESTRIYLAVRSEELKNVHATCHPRG
jgi:integrase/recombinase XerD